MRIHEPVLALSLAVAGCGALYHHLGGDFRGEPDQMQARLSPKAKALVESAFTFTEIDADQLVDYHTHVVGLGKDTPEGLGRLCRDAAVDEAGLYVNPVRFTWLNPFWKVMTGVQMSAAKATDIENANEAYARRLLAAR